MTRPRVAAYDLLVDARTACRRCIGLRNPSDVEGGELDCAELGTWSSWQGRLDADVMVVGQDWGDVASFVEHDGFEEPDNPTNKRLIELLALAGVVVEPPAKLGRSGTVFLTNAILCLKDGGLQGPVRREWFRNCGSAFLRPTIELVRPHVVLALGQHPTTAVCEAFDIDPPKSFKAAVEVADGIALPNGSQLFPRYHCGARSTNMNRSLDEQRADWKRIGAWLRDARARDGEAR